MSRGHLATGLIVEKRARNSAEVGTRTNWIIFLLTSWIKPAAKAFAYNHSGELATHTDGKGQTISWCYDTYGGATARLQEQFGYGYDKAWKLSTRTNNALIESFSANAANELSSESRGGTLTVAGSLGSTKSTLSVMVSGTGLTNGAASVYGDSTWARAGATPANGANSYTATATDGYPRTSTDTVNVTLSNSVSFVYDGNGNLLSDGQRNFAYDDENQLISVWVTNAWRSDFAYDGMMRRRKRLEYSWAGGAWLQTNEVHYVYDGNLVVQERDANNLARVTYTRGGDLSGSLQGAGGIGGLLARTDNGSLIGGLTSAHAYYHFDGNGNVTSLVNSNGPMVAKYLYDPFGNLLAKAGPLADANLYRFSSKEVHANSALIYYGCRFYDANLQRWIGRDPIEERGGLNLYEFADNRPSEEVDTVGLSCEGTIYRVYKALKRGRTAVKQVNEIANRNTERAVKDALRQIKDGRRVVQAPDKKAAETLGRRLDPKGNIRGPETSKGHPEHLHPAEGEFGDVHIESATGFCSAIAAALAPQATRLSKDPDTSYFSLVVAGLWDAASAIDPIFLTDAIEHAAGVTTDDF
jgi:RHS repeat-associated protein